MSCVLVTGASRGIGLEFVGSMRRAGIAYWRRVGIRRPATTSVRPAVGSTRTKLDLASEEDIERLAHDLAETPIDVLIATLRLLGGPRSLLENLDWAAWRRALEVNLIGTVRVAVKLWPNVAASEEKKIVIMSSRAGLARGAKPGGSYVYRSSKAALNAAARMLALDLRDQDTIVTMLNPGHARTGIGGQRARTTPQDAVWMMRRIIGPPPPSGFRSFLKC
jgi:NAD(P)-dependent dehydrogenase (short-subunit alcohol dehydrogenase family)